jgi:hypothetical protein
VRDDMQQLQANEKLNKLSLTTLLKDEKYIFVEVDSLESMLMDSWSISVFKGEWSDLIPLRNDKIFAWCFANDSSYFTTNGWEIDDLSKRVYKKLKQNDRRS